MNRLDGKVALVSGAARGIGAETSRLMVEAGASVVVGDLLDEHGREIVEAIGKSGGEARFVHLDVTSEDDWAAAVQAATLAFGRLDILVNNAGLFLPKDVEDSTIEDWQRLCSVNLTGTFLGTRAALPALRDAGALSAQGSSIVNLSSIAGLVGSGLAPLYSMTKGGITTFTKSLALEFGRKAYRIRVNAIHPGIIDNQMGGSAIAARAEQAGADMEEARRRAAAGHPIGRLGAEIDVAKGIVFLASDDSAFVTGSSLVVDGGWTAQ